MKATAKITYRYNKDETIGRPSLPRQSEFVAYICSKTVTSYTDYSIPVANHKSIVESDSIDDAMIAGQKGMKHARRSPTPPPTQLRSTKLNETVKSGYEHERHPIANTTVVQLLSSRKFGSLGRIPKHGHKSKKPKRIFASISRLWSKSVEKHTEMDNGRANDEFNLSLSDSIKKKTYTNRNTHSNALSSATGFSVGSSDAPYRPALSKYESEAFAAKLWEEYEEVTNSKKCNTNSLRREKKQQQYHSLDRRSLKSRNSFVPSSQFPGQALVESIPVLEELIHEPQSLKDFLSVRYLIWSFRKFLLTEFSEENLDFWLECQEYEKNTNKNLVNIASNIYEKYIKRDSIREINIPVQIRKGIEDKLGDPDLTLFEHAQSHVYALMSSDSFKRFLKSDVYADLIKTFPASTTKRKRPADAIRESFNKKLRR